ncbi:hypothetical protein DPMN_159732 [Dreissena polymorpha]|uniref:Uncharacterized protein n=1 Tax=Dreissena polymorpha TaxID=45954 RepID=A0A9D4EL50_DREPO|nr:hypothetical protein DPMN_159732 [Dreissena polymorpha]
MNNLASVRVYTTKFKTKVVRDDIISAPGGSVGVGETRSNAPSTLLKQQLFNAAAY